MSNLFGNKGSKGVPPAMQLSKLVNEIQGVVDASGHGSNLVSADVARGAISMEGLETGLANELSSSIRTLSASLESVLETTQIKVGSVMKDAALAAGIISGDVKGFLRTPVMRASLESKDGITFIVPQGGDFTTARIKEALEAYDEKENRNSATYSIAYNMQASRQDDFGEAFFPTVLVTPDQVGFSISIRLIQVMDDVRRQVSGNIDNFNKKNIILATIDPTILKLDTTKIVPVVRVESAAHFVDPALIAPYNVNVDNGGTVDVVSTAPLAMGDKFSLLALSQVPALLDTGLQDLSDAIDTAAVLDTLYLHLNQPAAGVNPAIDEIFSFKVGKLPTATMNYAPQGNYRLLNLNFTTKSLMLTVNSKMMNGAASAILAALGTNEVRLSVDVSGSINTELGDTNIFASKVAVDSIIDANGNSVDMTAGIGATIKAIFTNNATMIGYDLDARRTNSNRRMRGQLLDTTFYNQIYAVPLRSPITVPRPLTTGDANDATDLAALITATRIITSNAAVDELLKAEAYLAEYYSPSQPLGTLAPEGLGIARWLVSPFYETANLNVATQIDSLKSHERAQDIQAVLANKLRDMAYRMYRNSGYKAAADALAGGVAPTPTIIIGTDPVIARYLTITGDFRFLGNEFNVKIVSTLNKRMAGKIVMTMGVFDGTTEGVPNPLHFGTMAWKPELTMVLPLHRNGANSKELTVQPSFLHVVNLPVMVTVNVTGISDVAASKVNVNMHAV